jgi:hypothetical protein
MPSPSQASVLQGSKKFLSKVEDWAEVFPLRTVHPATQSPGAKQGQHANSELGLNWISVQCAWLVDSACPKGPERQIDRASSLRRTSSALPHNPQMYGEMEN